MALSIAVPAMAEPYETPIRISAGPLSRTLQEIARQTGGDLLFDRNLVVGLRARGIDADIAPISAVRIALAGTKLSVRLAASGALIIDAPAAPPLARQDAAVSEILVIGRRTQNADIRRQETDIQPYHITTMAQISSAHVDDLGDYFATHVTTNADVPGALGGRGATTDSEIDLRGVGSDDTLVLIDGRRMPDFPGGIVRGPAQGPEPELEFMQPDLNALPLHAIDRVETLTGTAGGIYGYGALGGVVNVVLAHDHPGGELDITGGVNEHGNEGRSAIEGRVEFSPDGGATDVSVGAGLSRSQPITAGQHDYLENDRRVTDEVDPSLYLELVAPHGNSVAVFDAFGDENLTLKPQFGGQALNAPYSFLPSGFTGQSLNVGSGLVSHAGQLDLSLSSGAAATYLEPTPALGSLLMNVRHRFGAGIEAYFDGIMLWDHARYVGHDLTGELFLQPSSPYDPFNQDIFVSFPVQGNFVRESHFDSSRFTVGVVAPIAFDWRATAEATWGEAELQASVREQYENVFSYLFENAADPFAGWSKLQKVAQAYSVEGSYGLTADTHYHDQSARLAGPVFQTAAGPATLTMVAERRSEDVPGYTVFLTGDDPALAGSYAGPIAPLSTTTTSEYAEFRSRIFADKPPSPLLRGLEVQLALRNDTQSSNFSSDPEQPGAPRLHARFSGAAFTAGTKTSPLPWLMLRASFATGQTPPPLDDLVTTVTPDDFDYLNDPKRGGYGYQELTEKSAGSLNLRNVLASTASVGFVLTPFSRHGPQLSLDYSHIHKSHDVQLLADQTILDNEAVWPGRVQRGPLTDADRALGYTAGPITEIDATAINGGSTDIETIDARLDWSFAIPVGSLHLYGSATYDFNDTQKGLFQPDVQNDGAINGPLRWRMNSGGDWSLNTLTVGLNVQYFGGSSVFEIGDPGDTLAEALQGSDRIPAQVYMDLDIRKRLRLNNTDCRIDFGAENILNTAPPREESIEDGPGGYSAYGDPRGRRFELSLSALF